MARIMGIFADQSAVEAVVEQLQLNGIMQVTTLGPNDDGHALGEQVHALGLPGDQMAEYQRRLQNRQWLLLVHVSALDLPRVQRAFRSGEALDIDLLPETMP